MFDACIHSSNLICCVVVRSHKVPSNNSCGFVSQEIFGELTMSQSWGYLPLKLRQWVNSHDTNDYDTASLAPDHSFLALLSCSKSLISIFELKEGTTFHNQHLTTLPDVSHFTPARLPWQPNTTKSVHWLTTRTSVCLLAAECDGLNMFVVMKTGNLPLYSRQLHTVTATTKMGKGLEVCYCRPGVLLTRKVLAFVLDVDCLHLFRCCWFC